MTQKEIEKQADDYGMNCTADVYRNDVCTIPYAYSAQKLEQAFIDGAKWGMEHAIEWHDLRKDTNDLPTEYKEVLVNLWDENNYCIGSYNKKYDEWEFDEFTLSSDRRFEVIAWCELPQFKDKE